MLKSISCLALVLFLASSCSPSLKNLKEFDLSSEEKRSWKTFTSDQLNLSLKHPPETTAKDSDDLKDAVYIYNSEQKNGTLRLNMIIKPYDVEGNLQEIGDNMVEGTSSSFNYSRVRSGLIDYGRKKAYVHEYSTSDFIGTSTSHYQLLYPMDGQMMLSNMSALSGNYYPARKKMLKILRTLEVK